MSRLVSIHGNVVVYGNGLQEQLDKQVFSDNGAGEEERGGHRCRDIVWEEEVIRDVSVVIEAMHI